MKKYKLSKSREGSTPDQLEQTEGEPRHLRKATMTDVARLAGVGTMTVSRYLSGTAKVSEKTAQRVQTAIKQLNYRPNELARAFRGQRNRSIGIIFPYLYDPFFADCAHAVTAVARERGYTVLITTSDEEPETELREIELMLQRNVDGILIIPTHRRESRLTRAFFGRTPVVAFDRPIADPSFDAVLVQNTAGARQMVLHLQEHGHKRITFMGINRNLFTINARFLGYRRAMQDSGLREEAFFDCDSEPETERILGSLMKHADRPTAIVTSNNLATRHVLTAILRLGFKVPDDLAVVGFDDFELADMVQPPLTVIRQPSLEMGRAATHLLIDRIEQGEMPEAGNRIVMPVEMIVRRSCGCKNSTTQIVPVS